MIPHFRISCSGCCLSVSTRSGSSQPDENAFNKSSRGIYCILGTESFTDIDLCNSCDKAMNQLLLVCLFQVGKLRHRVVRPRFRPRQSGSHLHALGHYAMLRLGIIKPALGVVLTSCPSPQHAPCTCWDSQKEDLSEQHLILSPVLQLPLLFFSLCPPTQKSHSYLAPESLQSVEEI